MATREIPRSEWTAFFDQFSRDHLDRTVTVEVIGSEIGDQVLGEEQVFRGISADEKDKENRIEIMVGPAVDTGTTHTVSAPEQVWLKDAEGDAQEVIEIRSADGTTTLVRFTPSELPVQETQG